ncbi:hypothetical protein D3C73_173480 [compost metagenome]|jgi:hypothetical protein
MNNDPEESGPLTPAQHEEMLRHPLKGQSFFDLEEDLKYYTTILQPTTEGDPVFTRFTQQKEITERYLHLLRRFETYGVSDIITLDKVHDERR